MNITATHTPAFRHSPSPNSFARKRFVSPFSSRMRSVITVSEFEAARVGSLGIMAIAVTVQVGGSTWTTSFSDVFKASESTVPRFTPDNPSWPLSPVPATHPHAYEAKHSLMAKVDTAIASLQRVHGALPVLFYRDSMADHRCHIKAQSIPTLQMERLRSVARDAAQARIAQALPVMMELCPQQGSLMAAQSIQMWNKQVKVLAPIIIAQLRPIVIATDAARSRRSATVAVASSTGEIHYFASERTLAIRELEMEGIASAMNHFTTQHPRRKIVILSDSKAALKRIRTHGFGIPEVDAILHSGQVSLEWVRGHNGHGLNDIADRAARLLRMKLECDFPDQWLTERQANLRADLLENLRTDPSLNSYFYGVTQSDLGLAG